MWIEKKEHSSDLGNAPAHLRVVRKPDANPPRSFNDYEVIVDTEHMPKGVELEVKL